MNDGGQIVGNALTSDGDDHAFFFRDGVMADLGTLGGASSYAYGINNLGQVVGTAQTSAGVYHAFLYSDGTMTDLNDQLPANSGWLALTEATSINHNGQVVGSGVTSD